METNLASVLPARRDWAKEYAELSARESDLAPEDLERGAVAAHVLGEDEQAEGANTIDALYFALEDSSGTRVDVLCSDEVAVGTGEWMEWLISYSEFTGVDMTRVKKIIVGVGDPSDPMKGEGMIFIDEIGYGRAVAEP